jgi:hypothetical protein
LTRSVYMSDKQVQQFELHPRAVYMGAIDVYENSQDRDACNRYELYRLEGSNTVGGHYGKEPDEYVSGGAGLLVDMGFHNSFRNSVISIATRALVLKTMEPDMYSYKEAIQEAIL